MKPRVTADANTLVSGAVRIRPDAAPVRFRDAWHSGRFEFVLSEHLLNEVATALTKPYFAARLGPRERETFLLLLRTQAIITPLSVNVAGVASHPEDDLVLATAVSSEVHFLVTGAIGYCHSRSTRASSSWACRHSWRCYRECRTENPSASLNGEPGAAARRRRPDAERAAHPAGRPGRPIVSVRARCGPRGGRPGRHHQRRGPSSGSLRPRGAGGWRHRQTPARGAWWERRA